MQDAWKPSAVTRITQEILVAAVQALNGGTTSISHGDWTTDQWRWQQASSLALRLHWHQCRCCASTGPSEPAGGSQECDGHLDRFTLASQGPSHNDHCTDTRYCRDSNTNDDAAATSSADVRISEWPILPLPGEAPEDGLALLHRLMKSEK